MVTEATHILPGVAVVQVRLVLMVHILLPAMVAMVCNILLAELLYIMLVAVAVVYRKAVAWEVLVAWVVAVALESRGLMGLGVVAAVAVMALCLGLAAPVLS